VPDNLITTRFTPTLGPIRNGGPALITEIPIMTEIPCVIRARNFR